MSLTFGKYKPPKIRFHDEAHVRHRENVRRWRTGDFLHKMDYGVNRHQLRRMRRRLGLTQEVVAKNAGIRRETYNRIENGRFRNFTNKTRRGISEALGVEHDELFYFVGVN